MSQCGYIGPCTVHRPTVSISAFDDRVRFYHLQSRVPIERDSSIEEEEEEEFICQVYNNNNNNRKKDTLTGCQGGYTPINAGRL